MSHKSRTIKDIDYCQPTTSMTYLLKGWGHRDVRGPYINRSEAIILIPREDVLKYSSFSVEISLESSNLLPLDAVIIVAESNDNKISAILERNMDTKLLIHYKLNYSDIYIKLKTPSTNSYDHVEFSNVIAINRLRILVDPN